ncbi:conserved Plasmodium protein, unknown function [Plasmodium ovale]|uniref:Pre-mRNA polyadenylation factor Fip1 domain-containing protein n=1 Tax=Plasmodium ovale TaxID=36330 RepID=A0A1D3U862_PLAOA|nr:conserved Plasmodium protein, unknown function [Plasmodium ovale]
MEESDDEDNVQVIVFGNSTEAKFDDFYKEEDAAKENEHRINVDDNAFSRNETEGEEPQDLDVEAQVQKATKENRVFMKYEYTKEKPWAHHTDKSMWFNYNLDENSFKEWVQKHIDKRIEKQQYYQIENSDNIFDDHVKVNMNTQTPIFEEDLQNYKSSNYKNVVAGKNKMKNRNVKGTNFQAKKNVTTLFSEENSYTAEGRFSSYQFKTEDCFAHPSGNAPFDHTQANENAFPQSETNANGKNNPTNSEVANGTSTSEAVTGLAQTDDLSQFQNLINFFRQNPEG